MYVDQMRAGLDMEATVAEAIATALSGAAAAGTTVDPAGTISISGRDVPVRQYCSWFNFKGSDQQKKVKVLSGGERNRLLLARLFTKPANVLVMDEPTNDLDAETLDLLEELLVEYKGTLIVVSHDRDFLDNVVTSSLVFEGDGRIEEYVGGYSDWLREREKAAARAASASAAATAAASAVVEKAAASAVRAPRGRSLNAREQKELAALPGRIEAIEAEQQTLAAQLADPRFYQRETPAVVSAAKARVMELDQEHATAFARWEELEAMRVAAEA